jgi:SAM-dependent methyltransferase
VVAILGSLAAFTYLVPYKRTHKRWAEIKEILADLNSLSSRPNYQEAAKVNIEFFRAIQSPFSYLWWLIFRAPKLRRNRTKLVEIIDLPFPKWQKEVLETLSWFEVWMPILVPIREHIIRELTRLKKVKQEPIIIASIGCGGMELERQVIYQLIRRHFGFPVIFIGVDYSPVSFEVATAKFRNLTAKGLVQIKTASHLGNDDLNQLKAEAASQKLLLVFLGADAFDLKGLAEDSFDLVYHTRLRHHLTHEEGRRLDKLASHLAPRLVELDDLFSVVGIILISIFVWRFPAVLNGAVFSYLKDFSKKELLSKKEVGGELGFSRKPFSCYLRVYNKVVSAPASS